MSERTKPGTPCANCGRKIGKAYIDYSPYTDVCRGTCMTALVVKNSLAKIAANQPLETGTCMCCGGILGLFGRVEESTKRDRIPAIKADVICPRCSFRLCAKGDDCMARRTAAPGMMQWSFAAPEGRKVATQ
jgi:hypothetical protein